MQKKLIALAVAGLASTAAFAQSNVTLYGVVDAFAASVSGDTKVNGGSINSGGLSTSRIGFKGAEDLGNGLKAVFTLEYRLNIDQNTSIGGDKANGAASSSGPARQQLIGVAGAFGTVAAGRLQTTGYDFGVKYDALAGSRVSALQNLTTKQNLIGGTALAARANNAVAYISPSFSGLTLAVNWSNNAVTGADDLTTAGGARNHATLLSANYDNGPIAATAVYAVLASGQAGHTFVGGAFDTVKVVGTTKEWALGGSYDFGVAKVAATYQRLTVDSANNLPGNLNTWSLNGTIPAGPGAVAISYASTKNNILDTATPGSDNGAKSWSIGYIQPLSKRTKLYGAYTTVTNGSSQVNYTVDNQVTTTANNATGAALAGGKSNLLAVGVNHSF